MKIEYDQLKSEENHKEQRFNALGLIGSRVHHLTFTLRDDVVRIISLRKANNREIKRYEQP